MLRASRRLQRLRRPTESEAGAVWGTLPSAAGKGWQTLGPELSVERDQSWQHGIGRTASAVLALIKRLLNFALVRVAGNLEN